MRTKNKLSSASYFISSKESTLGCRKDGMVSSLISKKQQNLKFVQGDEQIKDPNFKNSRFWGINQCAVSYLSHQISFLRPFASKPTPASSKNETKQDKQNKNKQESKTENLNSTYSKQAQELQLWKLSTPDHYPLTIASPF